MHPAWVDKRLLVGFLYGNRSKANRYGKEKCRFHSGGIGIV